MDSENKLLGTWKSNEAKTLASMNSGPELTKDVKKMHEDKFFGQLTIQYTNDKYKLQFDDVEENIEEFDDYYSYEILEKNKDYYLIKQDMPLIGELEQKVYIRENYYYVYTGKTNFKEYFDKIV